MSHAPEVDLAELLTEVRRIQMHSSRLVTNVMAGAYDSVFRGAGLEFDEVREYVEGDDPRSVDWNITARHGHPFVKKFIDERQRSVLFLLDRSSSMSGGFGQLSAQATAARLVACLGMAASRSNDRLALATFAGEVKEFVPLKTGFSQLLRIIRDAIVPIKDNEPTDMVEALRFARRVMPRNSTIFLLSDFLSPPPRSALIACSAQHDLIACRILTTPSALPNSGMHWLKCPETGVRRLVDWGHSNLQEGLSKGIEFWDESVRDLLASAAVDLMDVPLPETTSDDVLTGPILRFLRMREHRGSR